MNPTVRSLTSRAGRYLFLRRVAAFWPARCPPPAGSPDPAVPHALAAKLAPTRCARGSVSRLLARARHVDAGVGSSVGGLIVASPVLPLALSVSLNSNIPVVRRAKLVTRRCGPPNRSEFDPFREIRSQGCAPGSQSVIVVRPLGYLAVVRPHDGDSVQRHSKLS